MNKLTNKQLEALNNEALFAEFHNNSIYMAKEQKFPKWRIKYENVMLEMISSRFGLDLAELQIRIGGKA